MTHKHSARPASQRQLRVGEEVRHVLSAQFQRGDFRDPTLQSLNITVTEVRVSPDLRNATVFVTPLGGGDIAVAIKALRHAAGFLRGRVAHDINLRFAPNLSFEADTSFEHAARIESLLHQPEVARDLAPHDTEARDQSEAWDEDADHGA